SAARGDPHTGNVEVRLVHLRPEIAKEIEQQLQSPRMVDEPGLERPDDLDEPLDRQALLGMLGIKRAERLRDQLASVLCERQGARARRVDEDVPGIEPAATLGVGQVGVEVESGHEGGATVPPGPGSQASVCRSSSPRTWEIPRA